MKRLGILSMVMILIMVLGSMPPGISITTAQENSGPDKSLSEVAKESYWYSRYHLSNIIIKSGMGINMVFSPSFEGNMTKMLMKVSASANITNGQPAKFPWVQFAEFASATPQFANPINRTQTSQGNFKTLRWDLSDADKDLYPAALGQAGMKNILWAEDFFEVNHYVSNDSATQRSHDTVPNMAPSQAGASIALGKGPTTQSDFTTQGFRGFILLAEAINKLQLMKGKLAVNKSSGMMDGGLNPAKNAGNYYIPHQYTYDFEKVVPTGHPLGIKMPKPVNFTIVDSSSMVWDQLSMLYLASRFFKLASNPEMDKVFSSDKNSLFPGPKSETGVPGPEDLAKGMAKTVWLTLLNHHYDKSVGTFVDKATYSEGSFSKGSTTTTLNLGLTIDAAQEWSQATKDMLNQSNFIANAGNFIIDKLQNSDGSVANSYDLSTSSQSSGKTTLATQAGAIKGLTTAYQVTGEDKYKEAAMKAFDFLESELWDDNNGVYKDQVDTDMYTYTPKSIAAVTGALRGIMRINDNVYKPLAQYRYVQFFENTVDKSGFQQAEWAPTGGGNDGDNIPLPENQNKNGATNGTAAMPAGEVQFDPSSGSWGVTDYTFYTDTGMYTANEFMLSGRRQSFIGEYQPTTKSFDEAVSGFYDALDTGDGTTDEGGLPFNFIYFVSLLIPVAIIHKKKHKSYN